MPKYDFGDLQCTTEELPDGRYLGKVVVKGSVVHAREAYVWRSSESYASKEDAMRSAISYVQEAHPPE